MAKGNILLHGKNGKYINKQKPTFCSKQYLVFTMYSVKCEVLFIYCRAQYTSRVQKSEWRVYRICYEEQRWLNSAAMLCFLFHGFEILQAQYVGKILLCHKIHPISSSFDFWKSTFKILYFCSPFCVNTLPLPIKSNTQTQWGWGLTVPVSFLCPLCHTKIYVAIESSISMF